MSRSTFKVLFYVNGSKEKDKSKETREISLTLDNIKAQIIKHHQHISDREAFVIVEMVRNAYQGIGSEYETLIKAFYKRNDMSILELTPDFIKEFAAYFTTERNLKNATIWLNLTSRWDFSASRSGDRKILYNNIKERYFLPLLQYFKQTSST